MAQLFLCFEPLQARPDAQSQFTRQFDFIMPPRVGLRTIQAERKAPLPVTDEWHADERGDVERCEFLGRRARVGYRIANYDNFSRPGHSDEFPLYEIGQVMHPDQARHIGSMPVVVNHHLFRRFVNFDKRAERKIEMRADFRADGWHHFVNARETHEVMTDCGEKFKIHFRLPPCGHVARNGEQPRGLAVGIENRRNPHVPPLGFTAQRAEKADEVSLPACRRRRDCRLRRLAVSVVVPERDP